MEYVEQDFYIDDIIKRTNFRSTKWFSNSNIMRSLPQSDLSPKFDSYNQRIVERVLGILWDINNDTLKLNLITKGFSDTIKGVLSFFVRSSIHWVF